jgi:threonine synthase
MTGVETIAFELAESRPELTAVYAPVGGGGLLTGLHRGFAREAAAGAVDTPRLVGVHPSGASALPLALDGRTEGMPGPVTSSISGLQMAVLYDTEGAAAAVRESAGHTTAVSDEEVWETQALLARRFGLLVEPAGATALAGVRADARNGLLASGDHVAVVLSGAGYKDAAALARLAPSTEVPRIGAAEVAGTLRLLLTEGAPDA